MAVFRGANPFDQLTPWVKRLLIANFVVYLIQMVFPEILLQYFSLIPVLVPVKFLNLSGTRFDDTLFFGIQPPKSPIYLFGGNPNSFGG